MLDNRTGSISILAAKDIFKSVKKPHGDISILNGVTLSISEGEIVSVMGPSGAGKSTLLGILGGLERPCSGTVLISNVDITTLNEGSLARIRGSKIGFVFQFFNLIPTLTALENIEIPMCFTKRRPRDIKAKALELIELVGLEHRGNHLPSELSGGEQQRVAIARALANEPPILLMDEPTGNLDSVTGAQILEIILSICTAKSISCIIVTHDLGITKACHRTIYLKDGKVVEGL